MKGLVRWLLGDTRECVAGQYTGDRVPQQRDLQEGSVSDEAAISAAADAWASLNWETRFGELGSFDFAREAFMAGAYFGMGFEAASGGDPMSTGLDRVAAAVRKARGGDPPAQIRGYAL